MSKTITMVRHYKIEPRIMDGQSAMGLEALQREK